MIRLSLSIALILTSLAGAQQTRIKLQPAMVVNEAERGNPEAMIDVGPPFGRLRLVDEIDCAAQPPAHQFVEDPRGVSRVETILGRKCRVLQKTEGEAAYFAYRIGKMKLLKPGDAYVLAIEYPEDAPRSMIVMNGGNETSRGFHTGATFGDAFHPKYVNNNESIRTPLSGQYETWRLMFHLHDRFPDVRFLRGEGPRPLAPEDGFTVTIAQFSAADIPASRGAAVSRIRLFEVPDESQLAAPVHLPPADLPRRHIFWREEMADGVIAGTTIEQRDDAYTHIRWIENANADVTDPDTIADFQKLLDLTVVRFKDQARFVGAWLRPRSQLPIGFADAPRPSLALRASMGR